MAFLTKEEKADKGSGLITQPVAHRKVFCSEQVLGQEFSLVAQHLPGLRSRVGFPVPNKQSVLGAWALPEDKDALYMPRVLWEKC